PLTATATTELYTLSLHDALPISHGQNPPAAHPCTPCAQPAPQSPADTNCPKTRQTGPRGTAQTRQSQTSAGPRHRGSSAAARQLDRKSTRLNSSHVKISYAVFCL